MAPSFITLGAAALALAGNAAAKQWYLSDTYDSSNFFDKFNFFTDPSPNGGYVRFVDRAEAESTGLIAYKNGEAYIGVDSTSVMQGAYHPGRPAVRIESKARFDKGLIIGRFSHFPKNVCGTWPAFWTVGDNWPLEGEMDLYEGWNNVPSSKPAAHMGNSSVYGSCTLDGAGQSASVLTSNCDNFYQNPPQQYQNQGCTVDDKNGPWASPNGGTYAMEWTSDYIKLYSWQKSSVPADVNSDSPDTSTWGQPMLYLKSSYCNIDKIFQNQRLILNVDFCGNPVENPGTWDSCGTLTGSSCIDYVAKNPSAFKDVFWQVKDIRIFGTTKPKPSTSSAVSSTTKASSSSAAPTTTSKASSSVVSSSTKASSSQASSSASSSAASTSKASSSASSSAAASSTKASSSAAASTSSQGSSVASSSVASSSHGSSSVASSSAGASSSAASTSKASSSGVSSSAASSSGASSSAAGSSAASSSVASSSAAGSSAASSSVASSSAAGSSAASSSVASSSAAGSSAASSSVASSSAAGSSAAGSSAAGSSAVGSSSVVNSSAASSTKAAPSAASSAQQSSPASSGKPGSSIAASSGVSSSSVKLTTSTIYTTTTEVHTITKCPPTVTNCPLGVHTTTVVIPVSTTVCPVAETEKPSKPTQPAPGNGRETITTRITKVYTITSCAPTVTNCPVGKVTSEVITTTYCPEETPAVVPPPNNGPTTLVKSQPQPTEAGSGSTCNGVGCNESGPSGNGSNGNGGSNGGSSNGNANGPSPSSGSSGSENSGPSGNNGSNGNSGSNGGNAGGNGGNSTSSVGCTGDHCPHPVTAGASSLGFSAAAILVAIGAAMVL